MASVLHLGGPDRPAGALRDLLHQRIAGTPAGASIDWATYYFRDARLAEALIEAHQRGVDVRVSIEARPRLRGANDGVIAALKAGIGDRLRTVHRWFGASHLHTKLYAFGGDSASVLVGSFNPSGNIPEDADVVADIGDQDRGHNLLIELDDPTLVTALTKHARSIHSGCVPEMEIEGQSEVAYSFPRKDNPLADRLGVLGKDSRLRIAASHFRDPSVVRQLRNIVQRGGSVELLTHHTRRRTPERLASALAASGVRVIRYDHPQHLPMHAKFILAEDGRRQWSAFGSYNLTRTSRWLNREFLMFSDDANLWASLDTRWVQILAEPWSRSL